MRTQCKRIYSALPSQCDRICNGTCDAPCVGDASTESRVQSTEFSTAGVGLPPSVGASFRTALTSEVYGTLDRALASLGDTCNGRSWPRPRKNAIQQLVESYDEDICRQAAKEAREIVQSEDFAPNVTNLFAKKCADVAAEQLAERESIRAEIQRSLA